MSYNCFILFLRIAFINFLIYGFFFFFWPPSCPSLLPILEPEYAVRKIVDAILQEKSYLYMPRFIYFIVFLKR